MRRCSRRNSSASSSRRSIGCSRSSRPRSSSHRHDGRFSAHRGDQNDAAAWSDVSRTVHRANAALIIRCARSSRLLGLRTCSGRLPEVDFSPCIYGQMGHCSAPCNLSIDESAYDDRVRDAVGFLRGADRVDLLGGLAKARDQAASAMRFEEANRLPARPPVAGDAVSRASPPQPGGDREQPCDRDRRGRRSRGARGPVRAPRDDAATRFA